MPSMASNASGSLENVLRSLQQSLSNSDPSSSQSQLQKAKLALLQADALIPSSETPAGTLKTARQILETGALLSIRARDPQSFVRYYSQLQPFYDFPSLQSSPSTNRSKITGLYLLLLLSQGDYTGFHTLLESLIVAEGANGGKTVEEDVFIRYPVELERSLMEGSYDQVWRKTNGKSVPGEEFALFSEILVHTIRLEIASCAARSYPSLSIASAKNLLFLGSEGAVADFASEQGWSLEDGRIYFPGLLDEKKAEEGDQKEVISHMVDEPFNGGIVVDITGRRASVEMRQPAPSQYDETLILQSREDFEETGTNTLPAPVNKDGLRYLGIARGVITYSCDKRKSSETPLYTSQHTDLWDAAPLLPYITDEAAFHTIIPQLYDYDYTKLENSSLTCIGSIDTIDGTSFVDIFNVEVFPVNIQHVVEAPTNPDINLDWAHSESFDQSWDVYRVMTVGGAAPDTCGIQQGDIYINYAAEYWFYHK